MLGGETVQLKRWTGTRKNSLGQTADAWAEPVAIEDVGVDAPSVSEPRDGMTQNARYDYLLFMPAGTIVAARDRIIVRGHECAVEQPGDPLPNMFTAALFRTEVTVRRVT